jgi:hypothetical protein
MPHIDWSAVLASMAGAGGGGITPEQLAASPELKAASVAAGREVFVPRQASSTSRFALDRLTASHAATYLNLVTYDGSGQAVHPDVVVLDEPWNGYRYWMAATPYPNSNDTVENPSIWASHDGSAWVVPAGLTNPIHAPASGFEPDPCLLWEDGVLYCLYASDKWQSSSTGVAWSARANLAGADSMAGRVSPTLVKTDDAYLLWHVDSAANPNAVELRTSTTSPVAGYSAATICTVTGIPAGREVWHISMRPVLGGFVAAFTLSDLGTGGAATTLHLGYSEDGKAWTVGPELLPAQAGTPWSGALYRSCFIPTDGRGGVVGRLWYSGFNRAGEWRLGYTEVLAASAAGLPELASATNPNIGMGHQVLRGSGRNRLRNPSLLLPDGTVPAGWINNMVGGTGLGWDVAREAWTLSLASAAQRNCGQVGLPVVAGQGYTFSYEGQTGTAGVGELDAVITWNDAAGAAISSSRPSALVSSVGKFRRIVASGTAPVGAVTATVLMVARTPGTVADQFWFRRAQLEAGDGATPWTPSAPLTVVTTASPLGAPVEVLGPLTPTGQPRLAALVPTTELIVGEATMDRSTGLADAQQLQASVLSLHYFTAKKTDRVATVRMITGSFAAAATPTLARIGIYSVAPNGDLTLVGSTANDTALFAAAFTLYQKPLTTPFVKVAGQRYAVGPVVVSAAAMPSLLGGVYPQSGVTDALLAVAPRITGAISATDLPASILGTSIVATRRHGYAELLP